MKKQYIIISIIMLVVIINLLLTNQQNSSIEVASDESSETANESESIEGQNGSSSSTGTGTVDNKGFDVANPQNAMGNKLEILDKNEVHDAIDWSDLDALTTDVENGESCNDFIGEVQEAGKVSFVITSDTKLRSIFCIQTLGGDENGFGKTEGMPVAADTTDGIPNLPLASFSDAYTNNCTYYVTMIPYDQDKYLTFSIRQTLIDNDADVLELFINLTTIDMREYFEPQMFQMPVENDEYPDIRYTDVFVDDYTYWQYVDDLNKVAVWYANQLPTAKSDYDNLINNTPTAADLDFKVVNYDKFINGLNELQNNLSENYTEY